MPLSFRKSYKKRPGLDLDKNKRRLEKAASAKVYAHRRSSGRLGIRSRFPSAAVLSLFCA